MGLLQRAVETYDSSISILGKYDDKHLNPLVPIGHTLTNANIEITIDIAGNFCSARLVGKDEPKIIIPVTEDRIAFLNPYMGLLCVAVMVIFRSHGRGSCYHAGQQDHKYFSFHVLLLNLSASLSSSFRLIRYVFRPFGPSFTYPIGSRPCCIRILTLSLVILRTREASSTVTHSGIIPPPLLVFERTFQAK